MAQQPHIDVSPFQRPLSVLEPPPARRPVERPGLITTPAEMPQGPGFGTPGPDTGWALRIIAEAEPEIEDDRLREVLAALMGARAAHFGRAPTNEDLEVALIVCGLGPNHSEPLDERRRRWLEMAAHEKSPGRTAVAEAGDALYLDPARADLTVRR